MPFQHYLPATFLANFSNDSHRERRKRHLAVGDKKTGSIFCAPASSLMGKHDMYTVNEGIDRRYMVDELLSVYEKTLAPAIGQLIDRSITCNAWADTLIPFVTALLVRGPDFENRFGGRFPIRFTDKYNHPDNTNYARLFETQRLRATIIGASWKIYTAEGETEFITNDLGYVPYRNILKGEIGMAVPLDRRHMLLITPRLKGKIACAYGGQWIPLIEYHSIVNDLVVEVNRASNRYAYRFIIGVDGETINEFFNPEVTASGPEPSEMGFMAGHMAMVFEHTLERLLTALGTPPKHDGDFLYVDYGKNYSEYVREHPNGD